jgi:hypothetical protein
MRILSFSQFFILEIGSGSMNIGSREYRKTKEPAGAGLRHRPKGHSGFFLYRIQIKLRFAEKYPSGKQAYLSLRATQFRIGTRIRYLSHSTRTPAYRKRWPNSRMIFQLASQALGR